MTETNQTGADILPGKLDGIYDIVSPVMPGQGGSDELTTILVVIILSLSLVFVYLWRKHRCRYIARYRLKALTVSLKQTESDQKQAAFRLAEILCNGLQLNRLGAGTVLPSSLSTNQSRWNEFICLLAQARYSRQGIGAKPFSKLVLEARYWLRHWP